MDQGIPIFRNQKSCKVQLNVQNCVQRNSGLMFATTELTCTGVHVSVNQQEVDYLCDVHFSLFNIFLLKMVDICSIVAQKDCLDDRLC